MNQLDRFCGRRSAVFDKLRLVDDSNAELDILVSVDVPLQKVIRRHQHIRSLVLRILFHCFQLQAAFLLGSRDQTDFKLRRKPSKLLAPVVDQRRRRYHQEFSLSLKRREHCDDLNGLSKSHVVGQDSAKAAVIQHPEPPVAGLLIPPEDSFQWSRDFVVRFLPGSEIPDQGTEMTVPVGINALHVFQHAVQVQRAVGRNLHLALHKLLRCHMKRVHQLAKTGYHIALLLIFKRKEVSVFQTVILLFHLIGKQDLKKLLLGHLGAGHGKIQQVAFQRDAHVESDGLFDAEPSEALGGMDLAGLHQAVDSVQKKLVDFVLLGGKEHLSLGIILGKV